MSLTASPKNAASPERAHGPQQPPTPDTLLQRSNVPLPSQADRLETQRAIMQGAHRTRETSPIAPTEDKPDLVRVTTYTVKKGDTASKIAQSLASARHSREHQLEIMREINKCDLDKLSIGQRICVPTKEQPAVVLHRITEGDSLNSISERFNTTVGLLQILNKMGDSTLIRVGQHLKVPWNPPTSLDEQDEAFDPSLPPASVKSAPPSSIDSFVAGLHRDFGQLCRGFESQGKTNAYSNAKSDPGGASWGCYQIAQSTMPLFMEYLKGAGKLSDLSAEEMRVAVKAYGALQGHKPDSSKFQQEWNYLTKTDPRDFRALQHHFILDTHLSPVLREASKLGFDITPQTAEVFLSIGVQHSRFDVILRNAARSIDVSTATTEKQISALYESRREYVKEIKEEKLDEIAGSKNLSKDSKRSISEKVETFWNSVLNRYDREETLALGLVHNRRI